MNLAQVLKSGRIVPVEPGETPSSGSMSVADALRLGLAKVRVHEQAERPPARTPRRLANLGTVDERVVGAVRKHEPCTTGAICRELWDVGYQTVRNSVWRLTVSGTIRIVGKRTRWNLYRVGEEK